MKRLKLLLTTLFVLVGISAWGQGSTVTLTFNFKGNGWTVTRTKDLTPGTAIPAATDFIKVHADYYSLENYPTGSVPERNVVYNVTVTQNLPFDAAPDYEHIVWHSLWLKGNMLNANVGNDTYIDANGSTTVNGTDDLNKKMWGFVGNVVEGFKIYNRFTGSTKILSCSTDTWDGNTGASTYPLLTNISDINNSKETYWIPSPGHSDYPGGFYLAGSVGKTRMNNRDGKLAFWNQNADGGSTFLAYSSEAFKTSGVPVDGTWAANTHWYVIKAKNGRYLTSTASDTNVKQAEWTTAFDESAIWCVTGSSSEGYVLYNRAHGTSVALAFDEGDTDANDSKFTATGMKLYTVPGNARINGMADHKGGYVCIRKSNAEDATNFVHPCGGTDNGFVLGTWNSINNITDPASNYQFIDFYAELYSEATSKTAMYADALNAGASYFVPSADALEKLTAAVAVEPGSLSADEDIFAAYNTLKSAVDAFDASLEANKNLNGKYLILGNKEHTDRYMAGRVRATTYPNDETSNGRGNGLGSHTALDWDCVWKVIKNADNTYSLYNENIGKYVGDIPGTEVDDKNNRRVPWAETLEAAGKYEVTMSSDNGYVYFKTTKSDAYASRDCLHMVNWDGIVRWNDEVRASHFLLKDATEWAGTTYSDALLARANIIFENKGSKRLQYSNVPENMSSLISALENAKSSYTAYTALNNAVEACTYNTTGDIDTDVYYTFRFATTDGSIKYLAANYGTTIGSDNGTPVGYPIGYTTTIVPNAIWKLEKVENQDKYYLVTNGQYSTGFANAAARMVDETHSELTNNDPVHSLGKMNINVAAAGTAKINYTEFGKNNNLTVNSISDYYVESVKSIDLSIGTAHYATAYLPVSVTAPAESGGVVYRAQGEGSDYVSLAAYAEGDVIPAKTGVIIYKETPGDVVLPIVYEGEGEGSLITGCLTPHTVAEGEEVYILADGMQGIGLYQVVSETDRTIAANKAYYTPTATAAAPAFRLSFNELATAIDAARNDGLIEGATYNLRGERVQKAGGLVIVNGKKVMVK